MTERFIPNRPAEKALKAVLVANGIRPPYTHDIGALWTLLPSENRPLVPLAAQNALTRMATTARYGVEDLDGGHVNWALQHAANIVAWARVNL